MTQGFNVVRVEGCATISKVSLVMDVLGEACRAVCAATEDAGR